MTDCTTGTHRMTRRLSSGPITHRIDDQIIVIGGHILWCNHRKPRLFHPIGGALCIGFRNRDVAHPKGPQSQSRADANCAPANHQGAQIRQIGI